MNDLAMAKLELCNSMVDLMERLDVDTAKRLMEWLRNTNLNRAHHFEFWAEYAEFIVAMEV